MEISSIENSNLHIQIKNLNICTTHSKTHGKSRDFSIARIHLFQLGSPSEIQEFSLSLSSFSPIGGYFSISLFQCEASPPRGSLGAGGHLESNI